MLGRLFSSASSTATSPSGTRPSTAVAVEGDDFYTRTLLYPDTSFLAQSINQSLSGSGYNSVSSVSGDSAHVEIDCARDIRVIIAQDGTGSEAKSVVYDSKPAVNNIAQNCMPTPNNPFYPFEENNPLSPGLGGGYNRSRRRSPTPFHPSSLHQPTPTPEDELKVITDCMFGSVSLAYKGPSTKLHILPSFPHPDRSGVNTPISDGRTRSVKSYQSPMLAHNLPHPFGGQTSTKERKSVLITRLFSVVIPPSPTFVQPKSREHTPTPASSVGSNNGFPFPRMTAVNTPTNGGSSTSKGIKPPKTAMYAIGLVISLPQSSSSTQRRCPNCWSSQYDSESRSRSMEYCCDIAASAADDESRTDTVMVEGGVEVGVADDQMDLLTRHWDVITRALTDLQAVTQSRILQSLQTTGMMSPTPQIGYKYRRRVELRPGALMYDETVKLEIERFKWRIVSGIKIPRVVTGQGKWGVWRDEARWINKRYGGKEQNFFFLTLLTAFLGHHTDWLDVLGPPNHRRKHQRQQQASGAQIEECAVPTRTVIIANDKICARKLIYLLSAFLPAKNLPSWTTPDAAVLPNRASSTNMVSQSPPAMSYMRNGSLRRRPRKRPSKLSMIHPENEEVRGWDIPVGASAAETVHEPTQASSLQLAMTAVGSLKKSNIVPLTPVVVAAASKDSDSQQKESRPGSSGSSASFSLMHTLKRSGTGHASNDSSGTGTSGWGSFLSGIWSNPKSSSTTATSEASTHLDDAIDCPPPSRSSMRNVLSEKYEDEILVEDHDLYPAYEESFHIQSPPTFDRSLHSFSRSSTAETPLGVSVGEDGVINVEIPMGPSSHLFNPSMVGTSTANTSSPIGSPSSNGFSFSLPSLDRSSTTSSTMFPLGGIEQSDNLMNVAGWMDDERFHPDFSLQAVKPYFEVEADIKRAMRAEPTPVTRNATDATADSLVPGKWVEVCSVLVADTRACRIKRLRLKRRKNAFQFQCFNTDSTVMVGFENGSRGNENSESQMKQEEEEIIEEEWVMDMDDTLVTATERAIGVHDIYQPASNKNQAKSVLSKDTAAPTANFNSNATAAASTESTKSSAGDCKSLLLGALEEVVNKCVTDRTGFVENVLTEGVVKWLNDVEEAY